MDYKLNAGIHKKSFELFYNGGSIWAEHLDSMGNLGKIVVEKFLQDFKQFSKPSSSSFMIINFDETEVTEDIASFVADTLKNCPKQIPPHSICRSKVENATPIQAICQRIRNSHCIYE